MDKKPLTGKTILITRAREQSADFAARLTALGAEVIEFPTIEIVPPTSWKGLDDAIARLDRYEWLIFTSANGVHFFWQRLIEKGKALDLPPSLKICAIGPATTRQLKERGISVHYTPKEFIAESILKGFEKMTIHGKRILLARVKQARDVLPKGLKKMGAAVDIVEAYRTIKPRGGTRRLNKILTEGNVDVITFTSSSTVNHFVDLLKREDLKKVLKGVVIACIGPVTAKTARERGMKVAIQPDEYTVPALTQAIVNYWSSHVSPHSRGDRVGLGGRT